MKKDTLERFEKIENNLHRLSSLFSAVGSMAITLDHTSGESYLTSDDNMDIVYHLNYLSEIKDSLVDIIEDELLEIKREFDPKAINLLA